MKKYTFKIYKFNPDSKKIELRGTFKTKPMERDRLDVIIKNEIAKFNGNACYEVVGEP